MSVALQGYLREWERKPVLRVVYDDFYRRIVGACRPGRTLEIGGGIGNLKRRLRDVVATDIQYARWLDCVADAQCMPFAAASITNIVMVDVLHHIEFPANFFRDADRILKPGGRIVMVEPAITWGSTLFYRLLHEEPVRTSADPLVSGKPDATRDPYAANQAIPTLIATRDRDRFHTMFPRLQVAQVEWFSLFVYPLSGGFKPWTLVPAGLAPHILRIEHVTERLLGRVCAFRMMLVIQKAEAA